MGDDALFAARGFGRRAGAGERPALVVVDLVNGFTDPESPLWCDADDAVAATARLLEAARASGAPVAFTTVEYDEAGARVAAAFLAKVPSLMTLAPGTRWPLVDARIAPRSDEPVLTKLFASAFFGTPLAAMLAAHGADTVIVCGVLQLSGVNVSVVGSIVSWNESLIGR